MQWRAQNPPGEAGEQLLPSPVREGYLYLLSMADYTVGELWVSFAGISFVWTLYRKRAGLVCFAVFKRSLSVARLVSDPAYRIGRYTTMAPSSRRRGTQNSTRRGARDGAYARGTRYLYLLGAGLGGS